MLLAFSREGRLPMSKVGERLMVHPTSATNIIQRLAAQGLVDRSPNPADGRGTLAAITPSGREVMERATRDLVDGGFGLGALTPQELEQLFRLLRKVRLEADDFEDDDAQSTTTAWTSATTSPSARPTYRLPRPPGRSPPWDRVRPGRRRLGRRSRAVTSTRTSK